MRNIFCLAEAAHPSHRKAARRQPGFIKSERATPRLVERHLHGHHAMPELKLKLNWQGWGVTKIPITVSNSLNLI